MRKHINTSIVYAILGLIFGVFYREFTKLSGFSGRTTLAFIHGHYLVLGMMGFLLILVLDKQFSISDGKYFSKLTVGYQVGLNITVITLLTRGIIQVKNMPITSALDASISGIAGIGHIVLGVSLVMILFCIRKKTD